MVKANKNPKDTSKDIFGYSWEEIQARQKGTYKPDPIDLTKPGGPSPATEADLKLLKDMGIEGLEKQSMFGVIDRLKGSGYIKNPSLGDLVAKKAGQMKSPIKPVSTKDPETMTPRQLEKEKDRIDERASKIASYMIALGRGEEKFSETAKRSDPVSLEYIALADRRRDLSTALERRRLGYPKQPGRNPTGANPSVTYKGYKIHKVDKNNFEVMEPSHKREFIGSARTLGDAKRKVDLMTRTKDILKNPGVTKIYNSIIEIKASKAGMRHKCDAKCKRALHRYVHKFKNNACIYGLPDGSILIK